jgi:hypothetical protein
VTPLEFDLELAHVGDDFDPNRDPALGDRRVAACIFGSYEADDHIDRTRGTNAIDDVDAGTRSINVFVIPTLHAQRRSDVSWRRRHFGFSSEFNKLCILTIRTRNACPTSPVTRDRASQPHPRNRIRATAHEWNAALTSTPSN